MTIKNIGCIIKKEFYHRVAAIDNFDTTPRKTTYRHLDELSDAYARGISKLGIGPGDYVGIWSKNSLEFIAAYFGILRVGAVVVLINTKISKSEFEYIIEDSGLKTIISDTPLEGVSHHIITDDYLKDFGQFSPYSPKEEDLAVCIYTSGSTGKPKGVLYTHANHGNNIAIATKSKFSVERVLVPTPMFHLNGLITMETSCFCSNTMLIVNSFDPELIIRIIAEYKVDVISTVTPAMAMIVYKMGDRKNFDSVKTIRIGSSTTTKGIIEEIKSKFPNATVSITYGSTEAGAGLFGNEHSFKQIPETSVGYPAKRNQYRIVDGILHVKTPTMMGAYKNKKELFDKSFTEDGWYITGDLFRVDEDGFYYCDGRADDMFKSGGNTIYCSEIEHALESNARVKAAVVVPAYDKIKALKPVAFVITDLTESDMFEYLKDKISLYKIPRKFYVTKEIPMVASGKFDRVKLKNMANELGEQNDV